MADTSDLHPGANPRDLIRGDPQELQDLYGQFRTFAQGFGEAGDRLHSISTGTEWKGKAAENFAALYAGHPQQYVTAGDAFASLLGPLATFIDTLTWAQGQAVQAVEEITQAANTTTSWKNQQDQAASAYTAGLKQANAAGPAATAAFDASTPAPVTSADPGAAQNQAAHARLSAARDQLAMDDQALATAATHAAEPAPHKPGLFSSLWHGTEQFLGGLGDAVKGLAVFAYDINPQRMLFDPVGYFRSQEQLGQALWQGVQHPVQFGEALIDWKDFSSGNWERGIGELLPQIALTLASGGAGAAAKGGDAAATLEATGAEVTRLSETHAIFEATEPEAKIQRIKDLGYDLESPSGQAAVNQIGGAYDGIEPDWTDSVMAKGGQVGFGEDGISGYGIDPDVVATADGDATKLFEGLQVASKRALNDHNGFKTWSETRPTYRPRVGIYKATEDIPIARAGVSANPHLGAGGLPQVFVPDAKSLIRSGALQRVRSIELTPSPVRIEDPAWEKVNPGLPKAPLTVHEARVTGGLVGGGVVATVTSGAAVNQHAR